MSTYCSVDDLFSSCQFTEIRLSIHFQQYDNVHDGNIEASPRLDGVDIYNDLGDLENMGGFNGGEYDFFPTENSNYNLDGTILGDNASFIELRDLDAPLNCPAEAREPEQAHCNGPYTDQKCYNSEQSCYKVNPCFSQSHSTPPQVPWWIGLLHL